MGPCAGGAVYSPAITDFVLMVEGSSYMFITGPDVVKTVTGEEVSFEELGGAADARDEVGRRPLHLARRGGVPRGRALPALVPAAEQPRAAAVRCARPTRSSARTPALDTLVPGQPRTSRTTCTQVIRRGRRRRRVPRGARALTPRTSSAASPASAATRSASSATSRTRSPGVLDIDASVKAARFVRTCDAFNIPLVTFVDVPGFLPGTAQEWGGIIRHGAKLLYAYAEATVPKLTVITRKAYGGAYDVMSSKHIRADFNFAWPTAEVAVMGPEGAVNIIFRDELAEADGSGRAARGADRRLPGAVREPVHRRRARLRRRGDRAAPHAPGADRRAGDGAHEARAAARSASTATSRCSPARSGTRYNP